MSRLRDALDAGARLAGAALRAAGPARGRAKAVLGTSAGQRDLFAVLRGVAPVLSLRKPLIRAYPNTGTVLLTRAADVRAMLAREADFAVVYEPRMRKITSGPNFFLGMQDGETYRRDTDAMRRVARADDVAAIVTPLFAREAARIVDAAGGRLDVPAALTLEAPALMVRRYFGVDTASTTELAAWATAMFWYLFVDLAGDPAIEERALAAAAQCRAAIRAAIARREAEDGPDDMIRRCLALRAAGLPAFQGTGIADNLIGLVIGAIPTLSRAGVQALDQLLARPDALAQARGAACAEDDAALAGIVFEALRFDPVNPVIYRRAARDTAIAGRRVRAGAMVLGANLSAMFDPAIVPEPDAFRPGRPWETYMLWGHGLHRCFGDAINRAAIPAMLKPLLARDGLRGGGQIERGGTPFPQHFHVTFEGAG